MLQTKKNNKQTNMKQSLNITNYNVPFFADGVTKTINSSVSIHNTLCLKEHNGRTGLNEEVSVKFSLDI